MKLTDRDRQVLHSLLFSWACCMGQRRPRSRDRAFSDFLDARVLGEAEVDTERVRKRVEETLVCDARSESRLCEVRSDQGNIYGMTAFSVVFKLVGAVATQQGNDHVEMFRNWHTSSSWDRDDLRMVHERMRRECILIGLIAPYEEMIGPFQPKWLCAICRVDDNRTLKKRLGSENIEVKSQEAWLVNESVLPDQWMQSLSESDFAPKESAKIKTFLAALQ